MKRIDLNTYVYDEYFLLFQEKNWFLWKDISAIKAKEWIHSNQVFCQHNLRIFFSFFFLVWGSARTKLNMVGFVDLVGIFPWNLIFQSQTKWKTSSFPKTQTLFCWNIILQFQRQATPVKLLMQSSSNLVPALYCTDDPGFLEWLVFRQWDHDCWYTMADSPVVARL